MTDKTQSSQGVFSSGDVATALGVSESTLRKYCLLMEKYGHRFIRNEHKHRAFYDTDVLLLRKVVTLKSQGDITLEHAVASIMAWKLEETVTGSVTTDMTLTERDTRYDALELERKLFSYFEEREKRLEAKHEGRHQELLEALAKQQDYIEDRLEKRDQMLMSSLRELQETKRQIASAEISRKAWWKFWNWGSK